MKAEHKAVIERARLHDVLPSELAHELLVHDLANAALFELRNIKAPFHKLNEGQQQEVIDRITEKAKEATATAISIISSRGSITVPLTVKAVKAEEKRSTLTAVVDAKDPNCHSLSAHAGKLCLLVLAPDDYDEGLDFIQPDRDQHEMPLHVSELTGSLFDRAADAVHSAPPADAQPNEESPLYRKAVVFVTKSRTATVPAVQRALDISFERADELVSLMEAKGVVGPIDHTGERDVIWPAPEQNDEDVVDAEFHATDEPVSETHADTGKEFGDLSYSEAQQIVVLHGTSVTNAWLQRRIGISEDQATTLLLRLSDDDVIALETEADASIDNTYTVKAGLADLTME